MNNGELIRRSFVELMKDVGTSIPGHIVAFDPATQLAQVQIGVKSIDADGEYDPGVIVECPVSIYGGSGYVVEVELTQGAEGMIVFSQRCIDGWRQTGGIAPQGIVRFHDINDASFIPGVRSQAKKITGYANNGIKLRNKAGDVFVWLKNDGSVSISAASVDIVTSTPGAFTINGINVSELHTHTSTAPGNPTSPPSGP